MKIAIYSCHDYFQAFLETQNNGAFELIPIKTALRKNTTHLAEGCTAISIFSKDKADATILTQLHKMGVQFIALRSAGYNNIDLEKAKELNIKVARVPAYSPHAIAEHTIALILALSRKLILANQRVHQYNFSIEGLTGFNLGKKTVGIIGTGNIGKATIQILAGFGSTILAYDLQKDQCLATKYGVKYVSFEVLLAQSDIISLHLPLNESTKYIINQKSIQQMKKGVMLINTSRGKHLHTKAVIEALKSGHISALGVDVYENESDYFFEDHSNEVMQDDTLARLLSFSNVILTPHQAFLTETALLNIAETTIENISAFQKGKINKNFLV